MSTLADKFKNGGNNASITTTQLTHQALGQHSHQMEKFGCTMARPWIGSMRTGLTCRRRVFSSTRQLAWPRVPLGRIEVKKVPAIQEGKPWTSIWKPVLVRLSIDMLHAHCEMLTPFFQHPWGLSLQQD